MLSTIQIEGACARHGLRRSLVPELTGHYVQNYEVLIGPSSFSPARLNTI
jgi:hypothetical protein